MSSGRHGESSCSDESKANPQITQITQIKTATATLSIRAPAFSPSCSNDQLRFLKANLCNLCNLWMLWRSRAATYDAASASTAML